MNIRDKHYPYPVLSPNGDDYEKSEFDVGLEVTKTPEAVTMTFAPTLKDKGLRRLIGVSKAAKIIVHVECPKTVFRRTYDLPLPVCETAEGDEKLLVVVPAAELSGTVSVCPFIVATEDICDYSNESFNPDYEGEAFFIDSGAVLAEGRQKTFVADTAKEALAMSPSIVKVIRSASPTCKTLQNDFSGDKIIVTMPEKMYSQYGTLKDTAADRETIWAMVFVPALVEVLTTLGLTRHFEKDLSEYSNRGWFRSIDKAIRALFGWGIDSQQFEDADYTELASLLVKNCIRSAFVNMVNCYNNETSEN